MMNVNVLEDLGGKQAWVCGGFIKMHSQTERPRKNN